MSVKRISYGLVAVVIAMMAAVSCAKDFPDGSPSGIPQDLSAPIEFGVGDGATKGLDPLDYIEQLDKYGFGVFAGYSVPGETFGNDSPSDNYFSNLWVKKIEESDLWSPVKKTKDDKVQRVPTYWPLTGSLSFFAYAPYFESTVATEDVPEPALELPSSDYDGGLVRGRYSPHSFVSNQPDFCVAAPQLNRTKNDGPVPLTFKHVLSRVRFYFNGNGVANPHYKYRVTSITIKNVVASNKFTYTMDPEHPCEWDAIDSSTDRTGEFELDLSRNEVTTRWIMFITDDKAKYEANPDIYIDPDATGLDRYVFINVTDNGRLYMLPQTLTEDAKLEIIITVYAQSSSGTDWIPISMLPPVEVSLPTETAWEYGKTVSYLATLDIPEIRVVNVTALVTDWEDSHNRHTQEIID